MGTLFEGGGGLIEGAKLFTFFYPKVYVFILFNDELLRLLLIKDVNFHYSFQYMLQSSQFKIN